MCERGHRGSGDRNPSEFQGQSLGRRSGDELELFVNEFLNFDVLEEKLVKRQK